MNSYQSAIPRLANSWLLTEQCEVCGCDYPADCEGVCDNCSDRDTVDIEVGRITVDIPCLGEAVEELTDEDIVEVIAA